MNNLRFYIFGVPDGFNMLSGTPEDIQYYQLFYDTSKKGREMRINRKPNGETVYSYLIYNLVSSKGREGAFLGMSLVFTGNEYCNNPSKLIELFEGVYKEVILKAEDKDKIVMPLNGGNAVGKFCLSRFDDRKDLCNRIGRIVINNVIEELKDFIGKIDASFDNSKEGRVVSLPLNEDGIRIVNALHSYMWVSLSSEVPPTPEPTPYVELLDRHFINELEKKKDVYMKSVIKGYEGKVSITDVNAKIREVKGHLDTIEKYVVRQTELIKVKKDYLDVYDSLLVLRKKLDDDKDGSIGGRGETPPPPPPPPESLLTRILYWMQNNSKKVAGVLAVILAIVLCVVFWPKDEVTEEGSRGGKIIAEEEEEKTNEPVETPKFDKKQFNQFLKAYKFQEAWNMAEREEQPSTKNMYETTVRNKFGSWFENQFNNSSQNKSNLQEMLTTIDEYSFIDETYKKRINSKIKELDEKQNSNTEKPKPQVVHIYRANDKYEKTGNPITPKNNAIACKKTDYFVVEGAYKCIKVSNKECLEIAHKDSYFQIRINKAALTDKLTVKINEVEYTFNVNVNN